MFQGMFKRMEIALEKVSFPVCLCLSLDVNSVAPCRPMVAVMGMVAAMTAVDIQRCTVFHDDRGARTGDDDRCWFNNDGGLVLYDSCGRDR